MSQEVSMLIFYKNDRNSRKPRLAITAINYSGKIRSGIQFECTTLYLGIRKGYIHPIRDIYIIFCYNFNLVKIPIDIYLCIIASNTNKI